MVELFGVDEARHKRWLKHMPEVNDLVLITLKGHLLMEEQLVAILKTSVADPSKLPKMGFKTRLQLVQALYPRDHRVYDIVNAVNELRNAYAHQLEPPGVKTLLRKIIETYQALVFTTGRHKYKTLRNVLSFAGGVLESIHKEAKEKSST